MAPSPSSPTTNRFLRARLHGGRCAEAPAPAFAQGENRKLIDFLRGTDVLIMDTQYDAEEYKRHTGWGHGCLDDVVALALQAEVKTLFLFHHDPNHDDAKVSQMLAHARKTRRCPQRQAPGRGRPRRGDGGTACGGAGLVLAGSLARPLRQHAVIFFATVAASRPWRSAPAQRISELVLSCDASRIALAGASMGCQSMSGSCQTYCQEPTDQRVRWGNGYQRAYRIPAKSAWSDRRKYHRAASDSISS